MSHRLNLQDATGVIARLPGVGVIIGAGATVPANGQIGFAPGCIWFDIDGAAGLQWYINEGSFSSAAFKAALPSATTIALGSLVTTAAELNLLSGLLATAAEINRVAKTSTRMVGAGSTLVVTQALHDGKIINLDTTTGSVCTLPAATGSGSVFTFQVSVLATTNSHVVKVANSSDIIQGVVNTIDTDTAGTTTGWATAVADDTITLNRTTTGSTMRGEWLEIIDTAANLFTVRGQLANTSNGATPFSSTV